MSFRYQHRPARTLAVVAVTGGLVAAVAALVPLSRSRRAAGAAASCVRVERNALYYCGSASARLSVFPGVVFKHGFCARKRVAGIALLQIRIGARSSDGSRTNDGLAYFSLGLAGSPSRARSGNVIAYHRSRRWTARIVRFKGDVHRGTAVTEALTGTHARATARFAC